MFDLFFGRFKWPLYPENVFQTVESALFGEISVNHMTLGRAAICLCCTSYKRCCSNFEAHRSVHAIIILAHDLAFQFCCVTTSGAEVGSMGHDAAGDRGPGNIVLGKCLLSFVIFCENHVLLLFPVVVAAACLCFPAVRLSR